MSYEFPPTDTHRTFNERVRSSTLRMVGSAMRSLDRDFAPVPDSVPLDAVRDALTVFSEFKHPTLQRGIDYTTGMNGADRFYGYLWAIPNEGIDMYGQVDLGYPGRVISMALEYDEERPTDNIWMLAVPPDTSPFMVNNRTFALPGITGNRLLQEASLTGLSHLREEHAEGRIGKELIYEPTDKDLQLIADGLVLGSVLLKGMLKEMPDRLDVKLDPEAIAWFNCGP